MVRNSQIEITDEQKIMTDEELKGFNITEEYLNNVFSSKSSTNSFLVHLKIFKNTVECPRCLDGTRLKYVKRLSSPDGYYWTCRRSCRSSLSVRSGSCFEGTRLNMRTIFFIMYKYINRIALNDIAYELAVDRGTVSVYADMVRDTICEYIIENNEKLGGYNEDGTSKIVEIDESYFFRRKYNRGRITN